ncbi:Hypothetical_protein [Hexamita inflata]|uniref:Hypothetical_protein n=1 Tax=Hexamita inflata TaxID=28002 RepID=A0ABP1GK35_9EUKA
MISDQQINYLKQQQQQYLDQIVVNLSYNEQLYYYEQEHYQKIQIENNRKPIQLVYLQDQIIEKQLFSKRLQREILELYESSHPENSIIETIFKKHEIKMDYHTIEILLQIYDIARKQDYGSSKREMNVHLEFQTNNNRKAQEKHKKYE